MVAIKGSLKSIRAEECFQAASIRRAGNPPALKANGQDSSKHSPSPSPCYSPFQPCALRCGILLC
ncbi:MAG: hypothetical protein ACFNNL_09710, partial [Kingella oralis]